MDVWAEIMELTVPSHSYFVNTSFPLDSHTLFGIAL